ncbi:MAG: glycosyl hydrolase, partial [Tannerella sp.]|nr:glycosyl hydrolase [Tannerella sp.]
MKRISILARLIVIACMAYGCRNGADKDISSLAAGFENPPASARPGVYWYFMDGNFSKDAVTKDLEAMKEAGIGHVLFLEVNVGIPRGKVDFLSEEWQELFAFAVHECERLEIGITLGIGPGWTGSGGPWVKGEESMQHLVCSSVEVSGAGQRTIMLPKPAPKQPFFGMADEARQQWEEFYRDVAVLAFPAGATLFDTAYVVDGGYLAMREIEERALYYRKPYSSVSFGVKEYLTTGESYAARPGDVAVDRASIVDLTEK